MLLLLLLATLASSAALASAGAASCPPAEAACAANANCKAFGVYDNKYQLHGCTDTAALVPNTDWSIFVPASAAKTSWKPLGKKVNIDDGKCAIRVKKSGSWSGSCGWAPAPSPPKWWGLGKYAVCLLPAARPAALPLDGSQSARRPQAPRISLAALPDAATVPQGAPEGQQVRADL